jgi:hypothetical protein
VRKRQKKKLGRAWCGEDYRRWVAEQVIRRQPEKIQGEIRFWKMEYVCQGFESKISRLPGNIFAQIPLR